MLCYNMTVYVDIYLFKSVCLLMGSFAAGIFTTVSLFLSFWNQYRKWWTIWCNPDPERKPIWRYLRVTLWGVKFHRTTATTTTTGNNGEI